MENKPILCLRDLFLFSELDDQSFSFVCHSAGKHTLKKGDVLFSQGDDVDAIFLVKQGAIKLVHYTEDGREVILQIYGAGDVIGEAALFQKKEQPGTATAAKETKVCSMSRSNIEKIIKQSPDVAWQVIVSLGSNIYKIWDHIAHINSLTVKDKVLGLFIRLANEYGEECPEGTKVKISLTQQDIASMIGCSRVMVFRAIKELTDNNIILRKNNYLILKNKCF
ncbi:Crp/Fnr family transcriptional regulator [Desulfitibacter alkalitolerans]|uniref:Crp/Fnr family transcriptional regulator n=1 Tax=Desulfitibacter alkalitolerans TaxID=264641 RepID=UPI0004821E40|nr:Crp/Fnr family transcriptional regulator [Desulfitibacter alkalitolerans]